MQDSKGLSTFTRTGTVDPEKKKWTPYQDVDFNKLGNGKEGADTRSTVMEHFREMLAAKNDQKHLELHDQVAADPNHPQAQELYDYLNKIKTDQPMDEEFLSKNNVPLKTSSIGKGRDIVKDNMEKFNRPFISTSKKMKEE